MAVETLNGLLGLTDSSLAWKKPDGSRLLIVLPTSAGFVYNSGIEYEDILKNSKLGQRVLAQRRIAQALATVNLRFGVKSLSVLALQLGLAWEEETSVATKIIDTLLVKQGSYPAAASGYEGYGISADPTAADASYAPSPGRNVKLTRQDYGSFNAATPETFAVGANGARLFSDDLIGYEVSIEIPTTLATALKIAETDFTQFELRLNQILRDRSIISWYWSAVETKLDEGEVSDEGEAEITFSVVDDGTGCGIPDVTYLGQAQKRKC